MLGRVSEWPNEHAWKACVSLAGTVGSNPIPSAITVQTGWDEKFIPLGEIPSLPPLQPKLDIFSLQNTFEKIFFEIIFYWNYFSFLAFFRKNIQYFYITSQKRLSSYPLRARERNFLTSLSWRGIEGEK